MFKRRLTSLLAFCYNSFMKGYVENIEKLLLISRAHSGFF